MASVTVRFNLDEAAAFNLVSSQTGPVGLDLIRRGQRVQAAARRNIHSDTGRLAGSINVTPGRDGRGLYVRIGSELKYALPVEEGTGPIFPVRGKFLRWPATNNSGRGNRRYSGGKTSAYVFARRTRGVPAQHYLRRALPAAR